MEILPKRSNSACTLFHHDYLLFAPIDLQVKAVRAIRRSACAGAYSKVKLNN